MNRWYHDSFHDPRKMISHKFVRNAISTTWLLDQSGRIAIGCWRDADEMRMRCWWDADAMLMRCWWDADEMLMICWWYADEMLMRCWWDADEMLMICWWYADEILMRCCEMLDTEEISAGTCGDDGAMPMRLLWGQYEATVRLLWGYYEATMRLWCYYDATMKLLCGYDANVLFFTAFWRGGAAREGDHEVGTKQSLWSMRLLWNCFGTTMRLL